jgi:Thaumatin family
MSNRIVRPRRRRHVSKYTSMSLAFLLLAAAQPSVALHHMKRIPPPRLERRQDAMSNTPLIIVNQCPEAIWPAVDTQHGTGPGTNGFKLSPGEQNNLTVSENWQGRVWGRANCSFNDAGTGPAGGGVGKACGSGDCNGQLDCKVGGDVPVSLAEFTLDAGDGQTYYDISLVDGYNIPMAIVLQPLGNASIEEIPPNLTNPCCIATFGQLAAQNFDPYDGGKEYLGTNSTYKLPLDNKVDDIQVRDWCPWNLMQNKPEPPSDGVYTYPDNSVQKPPFNPCYSACAKFNLPEDCCTGDHNQPSTCQPSEYSKNIKAVCPDAYSYAFDDQTSTFIIPSGPGFQIIFCPGGRSTTILTAESAIVDQSSHGTVSYGGGGSANNSANGAVVRDCAGLPVVANAGGGAAIAHSYPGMRENGKYWARSVSGVSGAISNQELGMGFEIEYEEPLGGVRVLDLARRGLHYIDWPKQKEHALRLEQARKGTGKGEKSSATTSGQEVGGMTLYLMLAGLAFTAGVFVML